MNTSGLLTVFQYAFVGAFFAFDLTAAVPNLYTMVYTGFDLFIAASLGLFVFIYFGWFHVLRSQEFSGYWTGHYLIREPLPRKDRPYVFGAIFVILGLCHFALHLRVLGIAHVFSFQSF
jgi:hypothetical protein